MIQFRVGDTVIKQVPQQFGDSMLQRRIRASVVSIDEKTRNVKVVCFPQDIGWQSENRYQWWRMEEIGEL